MRSSFRFARESMTRTTLAIAVVAAAAASFAFVRGAAAQSPAASPGRVIQVGDRWVCRRADTDHQQNATLSTNVALSCTAINAGIPMSNGMVIIGTTQTRPTTAATPAAMVMAPARTGLTPDQLHSQWQTFVNHTLQLDIPVGP